MENPFEDQPAYATRPASYPPQIPPSSPSQGSRFRVNAPWESFNSIRTENGRSWKLFVTYALDWVATVGLTAAFFLLDGVDGYKREFDLTDTS